MSEPLSNGRWADTVEALAFAEAVRAIDGHAASFESLRARAGAILSASSIVTAFLGALVLTRAAPAPSGTPSPAHFTNWTWAAVAAYVAIVFLVLVLLYPYRWRSQICVTDLLRSASLTGATVTEVQRDLARYFDDHRRQSRDVLQRLAWFFVGASLLLLFETFAWIVQLA